MINDQARAKAFAEALKMIQQQRPQDLNLDPKLYDANEPHAYTLGVPKVEGKNKISFYVLGCAGDGLKAQFEVANLMNQIAEKSRPEFIILLGDNFYDDGVNSATDAVFNLRFHSIYGSAKLTSISNIPCFLIPGNHDHNFHRWGKSGGEMNPKKVNAQVMHTFLDRTHKVDDGYLNYFKEDYLDLKKLKKWNMPSRFYSMQPHENLILIFLDSNTYAKDYLESLNDPNNKKNQANWLQNLANENQNATKLIFMHHALLSIGKRAFETDAKYYLTKDDLANLQRLNITGGYNQILRIIITEKQNLKFDAYFAAHDHSMYYYLNPSVENSLCQVVAGGGGGKLQSRYSFKDWENVPCFMKDNGFVEVELNPDDMLRKIFFNFYTVEGLHCQFDNKSLLPRRNLAAVEHGAEVLRQVILSGYENYFNFLRSKQDHKSNGNFFIFNLSHGLLGVERADNLRNFVNQLNPKSYAATVLLLHRVLVRWTKQRANSLITLISEELFRCYRVTYEDFIKDPDCLLAKAPKPSHRSRLEFFAVGSAPQALAPIALKESFAPQLRRSQSDSGLKRLG